jgi:transposase
MPDPAPHAFVGIDPALESFAASIFHHPDQPGSTTATFANDLDGFTGLLTWLSAHRVEPEDALVCVEATGVYAEALCYYLQEQRFSVVVESPHKVKRAFKTTNKNDPTDSRQIAEYAYRFFDQLRPWQPREAVLEQIRTLAHRARAVREPALPEPQHAPRTPQKSRSNAGRQPGPR